MRKTFATVMLLLSASARAGDFPASELSIGGVASGATEAEVVGLLGEPARRAETGEGSELHYPGLVVTVGWLEQQAEGVQRRVLALSGTSPKSCTPRGLCPGMPESEVRSLYGAAEPVQRGAGMFIEYQPEGVHCWLQVSMQTGIVQSLAVACQP